MAACTYCLLRYIFWPFSSSKNVLRFRTKLQMTPVILYSFNKRIPKLGSALCNRASLLLDCMGKRKTYIYLLKYRGKSARKLVKLVTATLVSYRTFLTKVLDWSIKLPKYLSSFYYSLVKNAIFFLLSGMNVDSRSKKG